MDEFPLKVDSDGIWFDVTGPDWLVNLGWWLKEGGASTIEDVATLADVVLSFAPETCISGISVLFAIASVVLGRSDAEFKMVRYASAHGTVGAHGSARATLR